MTLGAVLLAVHLLGAIIWVGGMFFALAVLRPGMAFLEGPVRLALHAQVFKRFFRVIWHVMPLMLLTGIAMIFVLYGGFARATWNIHLMTATGLVMGAVFVGIVLGPWRAMQTALGERDLARAGDAVQRIRVLVIANLVLGLVTAAVAVLDV
jgi:uncharacterized membrane protein